MRKYPIGFSLLSIVCFLMHTLQRTDGACEYPLDLRGDWYTTSNGVVTFSNQSISNFKSLTHPSAHTYTCEYIDNDRYITRARVPILSTTNYDIYFCMSFTRITGTKYLVQYNSDIADFVNERVVGTSVQSTTSLLSPAEACNLTSAVPTGTQEIFLKKDNVSSNFISCPDSVSSTLDMTLNSDCHGNVLNGMSFPTYLTHTYNSSCATTGNTFTTGGNVSCVYSVASGSTTHLTVFNLDTSTDETSTYRFLCYVISKSGTQVYVTYHPKVCQNNQTSTYVTSPGVIVSLIDRHNDVDVSPSDEEVPVAIIVGVLVPIVLLCGIVLFILYWKIKHRQRISHELELAARRNWRRLAQNFAISTKHELPTVEEYANHSKRVRKKKKKKKDRKLNGETLSVHSQTDSRRRSVWFDEFNNTIEEIQEPPIWQTQWETFNDPLSKQMYEDDRRSLSTARSVASVRKIWINPESTEKAEVESTWDKVAKFFASLRKH
uniref:Uncharacterized protein LOC111126995 isoform X1 n=1 Tax=Crassostrea virginica TaxID=6565 RepID=A0A8B8DII3_CRAVI|nr:uncharacterized protein LOC111126995 isoform X1 [Crassostrea virginica]